MAPEQLQQFTRAAIVNPDHVVFEAERQEPPSVLTKGDRTYSGPFCLEVRVGEGRVWPIDLTLHQNRPVRSEDDRSVERALTKLGWHPATENQRAAFAVASHRFSEAAGLGAPGGEALARALRTGGADGLTVLAFVDAILNDTESPIDVHRALDYTVPGLMSEVSAKQGGAPVAVPDFRRV